MNIDSAKKNGSPWTTRYAGIMIVLSAIIGGGAQQGLWTDRIILIGFTPAVYFGLIACFGNQLTRAVKFFAALVALLVVIQFVPIVPTRGLPLFWEGSNGEILFTTTLSHSLEAAFITLSALGYALFVASFNEQQHRQMVGFILLALLVNLAVSMVEFSYEGNAKIETILPYLITGGMFANVNHFAALVVSSLPLLAWLFLVKSPKHMAFIIIQFLLVFCLFAIGSRTGCFLGLVTSALCYLWFGLNANRKINIAVALVFLVGAIITFKFFADQARFYDDARWHIYVNTLNIIKQQLPFGTGLGSFVEIYQVYLPTKDLSDVYVNEAHNDLLQLILEGGILAVILIVFYLVLLFRGMMSDIFLRAVGLSLCIILLHSLVDYPLRTMGMLVIFSTLSGIVLRKNPE